MVQLRWLSNCKYNRIKSNYVDCDVGLLDEDDIFTFNEMLDENGNPDIYEVILPILMAAPLQNCSDFLKF